MGSHLGAIGFGPDAAALSDQVRLLLGTAEAVGGSDSERVRVYRHADASGSATTLTLEDGALTCLTPGLAPGAALAAECGALMDDDCPHERPLGITVDFDGTEIPLAVVIDDLAATEGAFVPGRMLRLEIGALAETITLFESEAAYRASGTPMAVESLIPSGLFAPPGPGAEHHRVSARILLSGVVTAAQLRRHAVLGHAFILLGVRSMGTEWLVGVDPGDLDDEAGLPAPGSIMSGQLWLSGHLAA